MDYTDFSTDDFVADPFFTKWVYDPDEETNRFWAEWLDKHPRKKDQMEEARIVLMLKAGMEIPRLPDSRIRKIKSAVDRQIRDQAALKVISLKRRMPGKPEGRKRMSRKWIYRIAAVLAGLLVLSSVYLYTQREEFPAEYHTGYGETKALTLPDGSKAILNANSRLSYRGDWKDGQLREVWMDGEAFFKVKEQYNSGEKEKFVVHNGSLDVEVLGTEFNVRRRGGKTRVVLNSGRIRLDVPGREGPPSVIMRPGELVEYSEQERKLERAEVDAGDHISWINNELVFRSTTLQEIAGILEENYGITLILLGEDLAGRTLTTTLPADDLEFILRALSETLDLEIRERENKIYTARNK